MATKNLLRVYNKRDKHANAGECYFLVLPDNYNPANVAPHTRGVD